MNQLNIQTEIINIMNSIYSYNINLNDFNKYYNPYDIVKINYNNKYILQHRFFHTIRQFNTNDLNNIKISYKYVKKDKGYYSRYTNNQALNILHKLSILDENISNYDFYNHMKSIINNNPNSTFFFSCYERIPIIQNEKDIYQMDLNSLFINIDYNYKFRCQLKNKKMLKEIYI